MKITKKLITLALAALMLLSFAVPVMAADSDFVIEVMEFDGADYPQKTLTEYHGSGGDIVIPDGVEVIWVEAFNRCFDLTGVTFPSSVTRIDYRAFADCTSLENVVFPSSLDWINAEAFADCTSLTNIIIPSSVTEIGAESFSGCTSLKSVTIPANISYIGKYAFANCTSLSDIYFGGTQEQWAGFEKHLEEMAALDEHFGIGDGVIPTIFDKGANVTIHYNSTGPAAPTTPTQPTQPEPTAPATPNVQLSNQPLTVDGKAVSAQAYNIGGSNFFKLRDVAMMLNGTASQFSVGYDAATRAVTAASGEAYTAAGGELTAGEDKSASCVVSDQPIYVDGVKLDVTVYNIGGSNYFMLRDLGSALGFGVDYDNATRTVLVITK